jgi:hypothetical protein
METITTGSVSVDCLGVELSLDAIYEDVIQAP